MLRSSPKYSLYKNLMAAMIHQALVDLCNEDYRDQARYWLGGEQCQRLCEALRLDHRMVANVDVRRVRAGRTNFVVRGT